MHSQILKGALAIVNYLLILLTKSQASPEPRRYLYYNES